jgi:iron complex transport system substrate-binding protein
VIKKKLFILQVFFLFTIIVNAYSQSVVKDARGIVVLDYEKRTVILSSEAKRIVPLVPSALRILVQVGAGSQIVALDRKSASSKDTMLPLLAQPELAKLPVVGDRKEPNLEAILELAPDLIITSATADKADALQAILGVPVVCVVSEPDEDYEIIRLLGAITGRTDRADRLVSYLANAANELKAIVAKVPEKNRKRVYLGLFTNSGRFTQTMPVYQSLKLAGGINVAAEVAPSTSWGSVEINKERIVMWDPEIVFVDWRETSAYLAREAFLTDPVFSTVRAVRSGRVHYSQTSHDGKDYVAALAEAYYMASVLYPDFITPEIAALTAEQAYLTVYGLKGYYADWVSRFGIR